MPISMPAEIRLLEVRRLIDECSNKDYQLWRPQYMQVVSGLERGIAWKSVTPYISEPCQVYYHGQWRRVIERYADPDTGRLGFLFTGLGMPPRKPTRFDRYSDCYERVTRLRVQFEGFCTRVCKLMELQSERLPIFVWLSYLVDLANSGHPGLVATRQRQVHGITSIVEADEAPYWTVLNPPVMEATRIGLEYGETCFRGNLSMPVRKPPIIRASKRKDWPMTSLVLLTQNPDWSDRRIASEVGVHPSTLSRYRRLQELRESLKQSTRIRTGFRDRESGALEAIDDHE